MQINVLLPNHYAALAAMPEELFHENFSVTMELAEVQLPSLGPARFDWEANDTVVVHLETAAQRLHELDGRLRRPPVQSLYYRLFGGASVRSAIPGNADEGEVFLQAVATLVLNRNLL